MKGLLFVHALTTIGLALSLLSPVSEASVYILVNYDGTTKLTFISHHYRMPFAGRFTGHLFEPTPRNACSNITPPPPLSDNTWFALISDYSACPSQMVTNVRNAGYKLIITYNDSLHHLSRKVLESGFPVVKVTEGYAQYLKSYTLSSSTNDPITLNILEEKAVRNANIDTVTANIYEVYILILIVCPCLLVWCCCKCLNSNSGERCARHRHVRHVSYEEPLPAWQVNVVLQEPQESRFGRHPDQQVTVRLRNLAAHDQREHLAHQEQPLELAHQELIQNILQQFQELQLDTSSQHPLGNDETNRLPIQAYTGDKDKPERCTICLSDFSSGESVKVLPCTHIFHPQCVNEWLTGHSSLCPLCKAEVRGENEGAQP